MSWFIFSVTLYGVAMLVLVGCAASDKSSSSSSSSGAGPAQKTTPDASDISAAERVAERIERARIERNWAEVNQHLATVAYTRAQRAATPSFPFVEIGQKVGELKSYELLLSIGGADFRDPKTGRSLPMATVNMRESYRGANARPVDMEFAMLKEDGQWRLAGVRAAQTVKRR